MSTQVTVRGVSQALPEPLHRLAKERGESLNAVVLALLEEAVGLDARRKRLSRYASWTSEDLAEFEDSLRAQRQVDDELWD